MHEQQLAPLTTEQAFQVASLVASTRSLAKESRTPDQVWEDALRNVLTLMYEKENTYKEMIGKKWGFLPH